MAVKIVTKIFLCLLQMALFCAVTAPHVAAEEAMLQTASSSRQSKTLPYQPFVNNLSNENQPLVQVQINGTLSATFLFDTGTNLSVITDKLADRLKLKRYPVMLQGKVYRFEGKPVNAATLDSVNLGGFKFAKYMFLILKEDRIALGRKHIDGIIGINLLQEFEYLLDPQRHQITMFAPATLTTSSDGSPSKYIAEGLTPDEIKVLGFADANSVAIINSEKNGKKYVPMRCASGGKSGSEDLILDTGAFTTIISPALANHLGLKPVSENVEATDLMGVGYISTATLERFELGNLTLRDLLIDYSTQPAYDKNLPPTLGMNILSKYRVLMDFANQKLYLKPLPAATPLAITVQPLRQVSPIEPVMK